MDNKRFPVLAAAMIGFVAALAAGARPALADPPPLVERTFGVVVAGVSDPVSPLVPDFQGEDSIAVTVLPDAVASGPSLAFSECTSPYGGTLWHRQAAHHSTKGPTVARPFLWLATDLTPDPPPVGTHTFTGPDSPFILDVQVLRITPCLSSDSGCANGDDEASPPRWRFANSEETGAVFVVVTALFSQ